MQQFLAATEIVDWRHPDVARLAEQLSAGSSSTAVTAKRCFEWVRDKVDHSADCGRNPVTCRASDVLTHRVGLCYAKSHLLAALLRANGIPAAFCYQRIKLDEQGATWCLHGLNAVFLEGSGWYRVDPRGNKPGVNARFDPPLEALAFPASAGQVEDVPGRFSEPLSVVVQALMKYPDLQAMLENLPDWDGCRRTAC
jgi:transglutaminase-like putative cysteine protease